jgi:CRP-like cAMP-binding protein
MSLRAEVVSAGLGFDIGVGGSRLSAQQRQKLVLARTLLKRPDILILGDALAALDPAEQEPILARIQGSMTGRSLFLIEPTDRRAQFFEHVLRMDRGRIAFTEEQARTEEQTRPASDAEQQTEADVGLNEVVAILQRIPLFNGIDRSKLKLLAFTSHHASFDKGQFVFKQGDRGDNAYVIIDGEVEVVLESIGGLRIVAVLGRDQVFGEMALLSNAPRSTSIRARTAMKAVVITSDVFLRLIEENSAIASNMMRTLANRLANTLQNYGKVSASHDLMTELPSQRVFLETAKQAQARRKRSGKDTAIMVFDLGALSAAVKAIARDEIPATFKQAAQRMRACLRGSDILAHLRDNQYGVILTEYAGDHDARAAAARISEALRAPFKVAGQTVDFKGTIEFRVLPLDEGQVTQTLERCRSDDATTFVLAS